MKKKICGFIAMFALLLGEIMPVSAAEPLSVTPPIFQKLSRGRAENSRFRTLVTIN